MPIHSYHIHLDHFLFWVIVLLLSNILNEPVYIILILVYMFFIYCLIEFNLFNNINQINFDNLSYYY